MSSRTDLAIELLNEMKSIRNTAEAGVEYDDLPESGEGYTSKVYENESSVTTVIDVTDENGEKLFGKPRGRYVTIEVPPFGKDGEVADGRMEAIKTELSKMLPERGDVLVAGLGNRDITADALGPLAMTQILATRHLSDRLSYEVGLDSLRDVSGIVPGVLGQTGIEVSDIVKSVADLVKPSAIITIDALAARDLSRLGCTVQITDAGVAPGSGIGNGRPKINKQTMGVPVIAIGVPTVISVSSLLEENLKSSTSHNPEDLKNLIVTPKDIDLLVARAARLISLALNATLFPSLSTTDILSLIS